MQVRKPGMLRCRYVDLQVGSPQKAPLLAGHSAAITSIAAAPREAEGGRAPWVASTAEDGLLRVWSCPTTANHPSQVGPSWTSPPPPSCPPPQPP